MLILRPPIGCESTRSWMISRLSLLSRGYRMTGREMSDPRRLRRVLFLGFDRNPRSLYSARYSRIFCAWNASSRSLSATASNVRRKICFVSICPFFTVHANDSSGSIPHSRRTSPPIRSDYMSSSPYSIACSRFKTKLSRYPSSWGLGVAHATRHSGLISFAVICREVITDGI